MSERMTGVRPRNVAPEWRGHGIGFQGYGRKTRAEMIEKYRAHYRHQLEEAQYALSLADEELSVTTYLGPWARNSEKEVPHA